MSGDEIRSLPVTPNKVSQKGDLELVASIFQSKNIPVIKQAANTFKLPLVSAMLFLILSLPIVIKFAEMYTGNPISARLMLALGFVISLYIIQKLVLHM